MKITAFLGPDLDTRIVMLPLTPVVDTGLEEEGGRGLGLGGSSNVFEVWVVPSCPSHFFLKDTTKIEKIKN